jgi:hypothetical protein
VSDFPFTSVTAALADSPLTFDELVDKLGARLRTGIVHPDLDASINFMRHQGLIRFQPDSCDWEHDGSCVLEVTP